MKQYALLCGSAPENFRQKKLVDMHNSLVSKEWGGFSEHDIVIFPNGVSELLLECALNNMVEQGAQRILLYFYTESPVKNNDEVIWLCGEGIRKDIIEYCKSNFTNIEFQIIYDVSNDFISEAELGYEKGKK